MNQLESYPAFQEGAFCAVQIKGNIKPCMCGHLKLHPQRCTSEQFS